MLPPPWAGTNRRAPGACACRQSARSLPPDRRWSRVRACRRRPWPASRARCFALRGKAGEALAETGVVGVDPELLAGFGVGERHQAEIGQVELERIEEAHRHHL